jgi:hypothetical protein
MTKRSDSAHRCEKAVEELVTDLLDCANLLRQILDLMRGLYREGHSEPAFPPVEVLIQELVTSIVMPVASARPPAELELASAIVEDFTEAIQEEMRKVPRVKVTDHRSE